MEKERPSTPSQLSMTHRSGGLRRCRKSEEHAHSDRRALYREFEKVLIPCVYNVDVRW